MSTQHAFIWMMGVVVCGAAELANAQPTVIAAHFGQQGVVRYNWPDGAVLDMFVGVGVGPVVNANVLLVGPGPALYVAEGATDAVYRYDAATGQFIDTFVQPGANGLEFPAGLAFGPDGNLYVSSNHTSSILRYDGATGTPIDVFVPSNTAGLTFPRALAFGPDGNLYVTSGRRVLRFDGQTGAFMDVAIDSDIAPFMSAYSMVFDDVGTLYVAYATSDLTDRGQVVQLPLGGMPTVLVPPDTGGLGDAKAITIGPDHETLIVASCRADAPQLLKYDRMTGAFLGVYVDFGKVGTGTLNCPVSIALLPRTCPADLNRDFVVDLEDLAQLIQSFGSLCP